MNWNVIVKVLESNGIVIDMTTLYAYLDKYGNYDINNIESWLVDNFNIVDNNTQNIIIDVLVDMQNIKEIIAKSFSQEKIEIGFRKVRFARISIALSEFGENPSENYVIMCDCLDEFCDSVDILKLLSYIHLDSKFDQCVIHIKNWLRSEQKILIK